MSDVAEAVQPPAPVSAPALALAPAPAPAPVPVPAEPVKTDETGQTEQTEQPEAEQPQPPAEHENGAEDAEGADTADKTVHDVDQELEAMKKRLQQMEAESLALTDDPAAKGEGQEATNVIPATVPAVADNPTGGDEAIADADARSIYVGNVDYNATVDELSAYFSECGTINRVTIMTHKPTGQPKGFAYVEFKDQHAVQNAMILNESMFKGRQLKIVPKRTNVPGMVRGAYRGRGHRGRGSGGYYYGRRPRPRGRGRWVPY